MPKISFVVGAVGALAISCASSHGQPREVAAGAGCRSLGDASQTVATALSPEAVYGADRVDVDRAISVTGTQPGSVVYLRATPGMSQEYLERVLSCHAAYGHAVGPSDPFHPQGGNVARVQVASAGAGYAVRVVGENRRTDDEIWRRARDLAYSTVQAEQLASTALRAGPHPE
jgi:hypothetical protein